ncbi:MAG TPA: carboxypeptidase-like regulatory domain-containing protein [Ignavibacteria bacterium]|nr:carboxypeptidase-like regulatory domain-containing protein [Ignavibacteria bacterium]
MANKSLIFSGVVTDKDERAIPGANIYFIKAPVDLPDISGLTDNEGRFTLSVPVEGKFEIGISADGFPEKVIEINISKDRTKSINVKL